MLSAPALSLSVLPLLPHLWSPPCFLFSFCRSSPAPLVCLTPAGFSPWSLSLELPFPSVCPPLSAVCPSLSPALSYSVPSSLPSFSAGQSPESPPFLSFSQVSFSFFAIPPMFKQIHPFQHLFFEFPFWFVSLTFTISFCLVHLTQTNVSQRIWPVTGSELYVHYLVKLLLKFCEVGLSIPIYKCNNWCSEKFLQLDQGHRVRHG